MNEETFRVLEFDKIRGILAGFTATEPGRGRVRNLRPLDSAEEVVSSLADIAEMTTLLDLQGSPPVGGCRDLSEALRRLRAEGSRLDAENLLEVLLSLEAARDCRRYFSVGEETPKLAALAGALDPLKELAQRLRESIGARGEILDGASFALSDLRREIRQVRARIKKVLEDMLSAEQLAGAFQDRLITERSGRYVVPVRADHRGQVKGFVHDESASGQTLYVEPAAVLERNNELRALLREEQREEERILRRLSDAVRRAAEPLRTNQEILAHLDFVAAVARFARQAEAVAPVLADEPLIELRAARHPLLLFHANGEFRPQGAVAIDLLLGAGSDTLVVSGPNTGGKTVALKTAGLLLLMVRCGLPVPCAGGSRIHLFGKVFADIGDEQSIEENLSTFSGHLVRIRRILEEADGDSLVLLDEAGTGTDPAEGGALALAVLDTLRERGARAIVTTHLNLVKGYAQVRRGVDNAAVEFDSRTLAPTYRLHYGIPGASSAFTIARLLGLPEEVLSRAAGYLGEGEAEGLALTEELNRLARELEQDRAEARLLRERAEQERRKRKRLLDELEEQKGAILEKTKRRGETIVREAEAKVKSLYDQARGSVADVRSQAEVAGGMRAVREDLGNLRSAPRRKGAVPRDVVPGEILRLAAYGTEGEVARVQGGEVELVVHGKKLRLPLSALEQFAPRRYVARRQGPAKVRSRVERESAETKLLLVGQRAEEALLRLDRFLDDALLHGLREVEVVHGAGEGILRQAVRDFLAAHRGVAAFHGADPSRGGDKVTVVEMKG